MENIPLSAVISVKRWKSRAMTQTEGGGVLVSFPVNAVRAVVHYAHFA